LNVIVIEDRARIPNGIASLAAFRDWARSDDFPAEGHYGYLGGELWVDLSMEQLFSHNDVKTQFTVILGSLVRSTGIGRFFSDGTLLTNAGADLATEPDGIFVSYDSFRGGNVRLVEGATQGYVELEGSPDMVLEVVSTASARKDNETLRRLYRRAGVREYWLVDARGAEPLFSILHPGGRGYVGTRPQAGGWLRSAMFERSFRLTVATDPLGHPQFTVEVRESPPPR
jgi:Uma2 family endonuclease